MAAEPVPTAPTAPATYEVAAAAYDRGSTQEALELIEQGLAAAPRDLRLLSLKGTVLLELRDYPGALAAYQAYLRAGPRGANRHGAEKIVERLRAASSTFLELSLANGPGDVYLDSKTLGAFCRAAPTCRRGVLPGEYKVIVERPGFERWTRQVKLEAGKATSLAVDLVEQPTALTTHVSPEGARVAVDGAPREPAPDPARSLAAGEPPATVPPTSALAGPPPPPIAASVATPPPVPRGLTLRRGLALAAGGIGLSALGGGILLGLEARQLDADAGALCPSPASPCPDALEATALNRRGRSRAREANAAYGIAGIAGIAAAILWVTGAPESRFAVVPHLAPHPGGAAGLDLSGRF